jgi:hypothetical protein
VSFPRSKRYEYPAEADRAERIAAAGPASLALPHELAPEQLVLAGLVRGTLASLGRRIDGEEIG